MRDFLSVLSVYQRYHSCHSQASLMWKNEDHCNLHQHVPLSPASLKNNCTSWAQWCISVICLCRCQGNCCVSASWREFLASGKSRGWRQLPRTSLTKAAPWSLNPLPTHHIYKIPRVSVIWGVKVKQINMITRNSIPQKMMPLAIKIGCKIGLIAAIYLVNEIFYRILV